MAQSFVSLGNLEIERGDAAVAEAGGERAAGASYYSVARTHMEAARDAYVQGFNSSHPKVAWALEGRLVSKGQIRLWQYSRPLYRAPAGLQANSYQATVKAPPHKRLGWSAARDARDARGASRSSLKTAAALVRI